MVASGRSSLREDALRGLLVVLLLPGLAGRSPAAAIGRRSRWCATACHCSRLIPDTFSSLRALLARCCGRSRHSSARVRACLAAVRGLLRRCGGYFWWRMSASGLSKGPNCPLWPTWRCPFVRTGRIRGASIGSLLALSYSAKLTAIFLDSLAFACSTALQEVLSGDRAEQERGLHLCANSRLLLPVAGGV